MITTLKKYLELCVISLFFSCAPRYSYVPEPEKDIKEWVKNFGYQRSFSYEYELRTAVSKITARGDCITNWAEHVNGIWDYGDTVMHLEHIGINDKEWTKKDGKWELSIRGEESDVLAQIKRILEFEHFELLNTREDYDYRFNATLPYLAPEKWRAMVAYIKISRRNYLPSLIWVGLPDSSVYWQIRISHYNHNKKIEPPYSETKAYEVKIDSTIDRKQAIKQIKRRLDLLKLKWNLTEVQGKIVLLADGVYRIDDIRDMLSPGITTIYGIAQKTSEAKRIAYDKQNPKNSVYLGEWELRGDMIKDVTIKYDNLLKPFMLIKFKEKTEFPEKIAIEVDSNIVAIISLDKVKKMDKIMIYIDMPYLDLCKLKSFMCEPLFRIDILPISREFH
ncbi:MAG: hypothetical protein ACPL28_07050 [bacterium]